MFNTNAERIFFKRKSALFLYLFVYGKLIKAQNKSYSACYQNGGFFKNTAVPITILFMEGFVWKWITTHLERALES